MKNKYPESIAEAADLLDQVNPGWAKKIEHPLVMDNLIRCVLGQVYGEYRNGIKKIFRIDSNIELEKDEIFGCKAPVSKWNKEIYNRCNISHNDLSWAIDQYAAGKRVRHNSWPKDKFLDDNTKFYELKTLTDGWKLDDTFRVKAGSRLRHEGEEFIVGMTDHNTYILIGFHDGNRWDDAKTIKVDLGDEFDFSLLEKDNIKEWTLVSL